jgi:hypothetical protein
MSKKTLGKKPQETPKEDAKEDAKILKVVNHNRLKACTT